MAKRRDSSDVEVTNTTEESNAQDQLSRHCHNRDARRNCGMGQLAHGERKELAQSGVSQFEDVAR
jgi:hypothetical protein